MSAIRRFIDRRLGRGEAAITVPILDGPLMPNAALDAATCFAEVPQADNLVATDKGLICSAGSEVRRMDWVEGVETTILDLPAPVSAMAGGKGMLAIGVDGQGVVIHGGQYDGRRFDGAARPRGRNIRPRWPFWMVPPCLPPKGQRRTRRQTGGAT